LQNLKIFARVHALPRRLAEARSIETLEAVVLRDRANDPIWTLSGGMKWRLNLARGLVIDRKPLSSMNRLSAWIRSRAKASS
jgi:ABC-type multidrug transport system ATPase subunit